MAKITKSYTVKRIAELTEKNSKFNKQILELQEQSIRDNQIYNEQLAEKEKEIEKLSYKLNEKQKSDSGRGWKLENGKIIYFCNYLSDYKCERSLEDVVKDLNQMTKESDTAWEIRTLYQGLKNDNQDKISFCIEQLEKVKDVISKNFDGIGFNTYCERIRPIEKYIDNQIEELKKGSEQNDK